MKWHETLSCGQSLVCIVSAAWMIVAGYFGLVAVVDPNYGLAAVLGTITLAFAIGIYLTIKRKFVGLVVSFATGILGPIVLVPWVGWWIIFIPLAFPCLFYAIGTAANEI